MTHAPIGPITLDEPALEAWGARIGREAETPLVLALRGELGAGKSVLARAIARGAGVDSHMPSPTFNLVYEYMSARGLTVVHLDLYRLTDPAEVWELGWSEMGGSGQIMLIEWPERAEALLPSDRWDIALERDAADDGLRQVTARPAGNPKPLPDSAR